MSARFALVLCLTFCATGCAGGGAIVGDAESLAEVNRSLQKQEARIELVDGNAFAAAEITVAPDSTRFQSEAGPAAVATPQVRRITYEPKRASVQAGVLGGAVAGFALAVVSGASIGTPIVVAVGAGLGLLFGLGEQVDRGTVVAYEAPHTRYAAGPE